jgi:uncharacterized iron-regulated protein
LFCQIQKVLIVHQDTTKTYSVTFLDFSIYLKMNKVILFSFLVSSLNLLSQNEQAFVIYNSKGKETNFRALAKHAKQANFVFFGEFHDNPISHWLQFELTKSLFLSKGNDLVLGFEMFEQDQQLILNDFVSGNISEKQFSDSCRLWPNYETDYKPLVDFAKENNLVCLADNIQRKYASLLFKKGRKSLDTLSPDIKAQMVDVNFPVDTTLSQYREIRSMGGEHMGINMIEAQAIKDATMAKFIWNGIKNENNLVLHFNGAFHTDFYQGIIWYLKNDKRWTPDKKVITVTTVSQKEIDKLDKEHFGRADFIICVPESMTKTH